MSGHSGEASPYTVDMDRVREWFGSPTAAARTLVWVIGASLLLSVALGAVLVVIAALPS